MPIEAVIFDMDGVLIDSEPFWEEAEIQVFQSVGVPLTREQCKETMGFRIDEVVAYRFERCEWDTNKHPFDSVTRRIMDEVESNIHTRGVALPGVFESIALFQKKGLKLAIASSSAMRLIEAVCDRLRIRREFDALHSAEGEEFGKPHPAVYLHAARKLGVDPTRCLAIEDSVTGLISARAARMTCVAVPEARVRTDPRFSIAELVLDDLTALPERWIDERIYVKKS